jgi:NAD(P)-dependent dehydrogenase (short-subunit alcohol dehydrogenase family)
MKIAVVDGQGGGIGKAIVEKLIEQSLKDVQIMALGTNALATSTMLRAGASVGATGENAICHNVPGVDIILGTMGILVPNAMLGELTPAMANAIGASDAKKILIPYQKCNVYVMGVKSASIQVLLEEMMMLIKAEF